MEVLLRGRGAVTVALNCWIVHLQISLLTCMATSPEVPGPFGPLSWQPLKVRKASGNSGLLLAVCGSRETEAEEHWLPPDCPDPPGPMWASIQSVPYGEGPGGGSHLWCESLFSQMSVPGGWGIWLGKLQLGYSLAFWPMTRPCFVAISQHQVFLKQ